MNIYRRALLLRERTVAHRRYLHMNAESGLYLPRSTDYIAHQLKSFGLEAEGCGHGLVATLGEGEKCILLRADVDALPMREESGESFSSLGDSAHCCGHDLHSAMLLGCAELLSEIRDTLRCRVVLMFQPGEEILCGCRDMLDSGLLRKYKPTVAAALHTAAGSLLPGVCFYNAGGVMMRSADVFEIKIKGHGGHGAYSTLTVDPIRIACRVHSFLDTLTERAALPGDTCSVSVGCLSAGSAANIIPSEAVLRGSVRCTEPHERERLVELIEKGVADIAHSAGAQGAAVFTTSVPPLVCDAPLTRRACEYIKEGGVPITSFRGELTAAASEDFALIAERVPSVYMYLSSGFDDERGKYTAHDSRVCFNEEVCHIGVAIYACFATGFSRDCERAEN